MIANEYEIFIFVLEDVLINNNIIIAGLSDFINLLLKHNKYIYIINNVCNTNFNELILKYSFLSQCQTTTTSNKRNVYLQIVKDYINTHNLYDIIVFECSYQGFIESRDIIYNSVLIHNLNNINNINNINYNTEPCTNNIIYDFTNINSFNYTKEFEYIPFYISSKTKHSYKWLELKKHFPIISTWINVNKPKHDLTTINKQELCNNINEDIINSMFGIFYCEKTDESHIGSLIEIGILLSQLKTIFLCGDNLYENEVLFNFKHLINVHYIGNDNLYKTFRRIQYDINPHFIEFKKKIINIIQQSNQ